MLVLEEAHTIAIILVVVFLVIFRITMDYKQAADLEANRTAKMLELEALKEAHAELLKQHQVIHCKPNLLYASCSSLSTRRALQHFG